jgi:EAL domain-containing protein (putative c-di-GMP-specific phosphodiesterase class I)
MLASACAGEGLRSAFQPIVDVVRGVTVGYEALARFDGFPDSSPAAWFAAAHEHGRRLDLEVAALRTGLAGRGDLPPNCFLSINVSPDLLAHEQVRAVFREQDDLTGVVVELTEQVPIESYGSVAGDLAALRTSGALVAVDDAGAGYAGLRHLLALRPSIIKLDRELVRDVDLDEAKRALVEMVGTFADRIDAWLLAEGIERPEELDALAVLGVPLAQGFVLARPGAPWPDIAPDLALRLVARQSAGTTDTVRDVVEPVPTAASTAAAAGLFASEHVRTVVVVDRHDRPWAVHRADDLYLGAVEAGLRVNVDTPLREAVERALTRDASRRYEPLLCTDAAGRFLGVVRFERLVRAALG